MITWVQTDQAEATARCAAARLPAMVSPPTGGLVSVLIPGTIPLTELFNDLGCAYIATDTETGSPATLTLATRLPGHDWHGLVWHEAESDVPVLLQQQAAVQACAEDLVNLFGTRQGSLNQSQDTAAALVDLFRHLHGWQANLIDGLDQLLPMPEFRERIDRRLCMGPQGPAINYPGMLTGPVEVVPYTEGTIVARSLAVDPTVRVLLGPAWSRTVDQRFDILELMSTEDSLAIKLLHNDLPLAFANWNARWAVTPDPPDSIYDEFLTELERCCPWPWDRRLMAELLRTPIHPEPAAAFAEITQMPSIDPYLAADDWRILDPNLVRIEAASGMKLTAAKMAQTFGSTVPLGAWSRQRLYGRSPYWLASSVDPRTGAIPVIDPRQLADGSAKAADIRSVS